jgi:hypothetical protein
MKKILISFHHWLETIPDKLYPFKRQIEGKWVRGKQAYAQAVEEGFALLGPGKLRYRIVFYRGAWHIVGSVVSMIAITYIAQRVFGSDTALFVLLGTATLALCLQEFILHPKRYGQTTRKGIFDIVTWVAPMLVYVAYLVS